MVADGRLTPFALRLTVGLLLGSAPFSAGWFEDTSRCFQDLGCFPLTLDYFNFPNRLVNVYPDDPDRIATAFHLFTRTNPTRSNVVSRKHNASSILASNFDPRKNIKIMIHGYQASIHGRSWTKVVRAALLKVEDANVISVDWSRGAAGSYVQATANTRVVGAEIAVFLTHLQDHLNVSLQGVHLIGHSLGAHVAGYAGSSFQTTQIGRITGLDPAQPFFNSMPQSVRLDRSDASFVDIIHTNTEIIFNLGPGLYQPLGHVDFYPDGGKSVRSCQLPSIISNIAYNGFSAMDILACSHGRAVWLFAESILSSKCSYLAHACDSFEHYLAGKCSDCGIKGEKCQRMGYFARPDPETFDKSFYLTAGEFPTRYCLHHWLAKVKVSNTVDTDANTTGLLTGTLFMSLYGSVSEIDNIKINPQPVQFEPGETYQFLVGMHEDPGAIECVDFSWSEQLSWLEILLSFFVSLPEQALRVDSLTLQPIDVQNSHSRTNRTTTFCSPPLNNEGLESKDVVEMLPHYCRNQQ